MSAHILTAAHTTEPDAFLKNLRSGTAAFHQQLESHPISQRITSTQISATDYQRYLQIMQRVVVAVEAAVNPMLHQHIPDIYARSKQEWLKQDLKDGSGETNPYPPFLFSIDERNIAYALGAFYVLEGSTLGGRVILKSLPANTAGGTRYFEGYGPQTGPMWKALLNIMCDYSNSSETQDTIISAAIDTFAAIHQYFNICLAHEATGYRQS